jgi:hypothetical protein
MARRTQVAPFGCFQPTPLAGWLPDGAQHQHATHACASKAAALLREMCFDRVYPRKTPTGASPAALGAG